MATAALKIRLSRNQILEPAQQLSDEDRLELNRALAAERQQDKDNIVIGE